MKTIRCFFMLAVSLVMIVACNNNDEPNPIVPEELNKLVGTLWVAENDNHNYTNNVLCDIQSIEFIDNKNCIITRAIGNSSSESWICPSDYNSELNKISIPDFAENIAFDDDKITITVDDNLESSCTYSFSKDNSYNAPLKDNGLIGYWEGYANIDGENLICFIKIIDNQRLIYSSLADNAGYKNVLQYVYEKNAICFNGNRYSINKNKITINGITYTKQ